MTKKLLLALGLLAAASAGYAQTSAGGSSTGLLGQQYAEIGFGATDYDGTSLMGYNATVSGNTPVNPWLDVGVGYAYGWLREGTRGHINTVSGYATGYTSVGGVKPSLSVALGYQHVNADPFKDSTKYWGGSFGVEIPAGLYTFTPRITYLNEIDAGSNSRQLTYSLEGNYWIRPRTAIFVAVDHTDVRQAPDSWGGVTGVRIRF